LPALRTPWACPSCQFVESADGRYCRRCGEQRPSTAPRIDVLRRWWETLALLVLRPGQLTRNHSRGRRRRSVPPLSLFLAVNLVFFIGQAASGLSVLSMPLSAHLESQSYSGWAGSLVAQRMAARHLPAERYADRFDVQQPIWAQATVIAMVPLLALVSVAVVFGRRTPYGTHVVFALHFQAWMLLLVTALCLLLALALRAGAAVGWTPQGPAVELLLPATEVAAAAAYLHVACGRVFDLRGWQQVLTTLVLTATAVALLFLHRWAVFTLTAWTV